MSNHDSITPRTSQEDLLLLASAAKHLSAADRRVVVSGLFEEALNHPTATEAEIFTAAYGEPTGARYWSGWLEDDFSPLYEFVQFLEAHRGKKSDIFQITRSPILEAIAVAARSAPNWLKGDMDAIVRGENHPQFLAGCEVRRGNAIKWLCSHSDYSDLLPDQIVDYLNKTKNTPFVTSQPDDDRGPGRPTTMHLIEAELRRRASSDHGAHTIADWAKILAEWHRQNHPNNLCPSEKRIGNKLGRVIRELKLYRSAKGERP